MIDILKAQRRLRERRNVLTYEASLLDAIEGRWDAWFCSDEKLALHLLKKYKVTYSTDEDRARWNLYYAN
jgi:hypothetical protein